jgi:hypothetical protein
MLRDSAIKLNPGFPQLEDFLPHERGDELVRGEHFRVQAYRGRPLLGRNSCDYIASRIR